MWYLIVLIPIFFPLSYFERSRAGSTTVYTFEHVVCTSARIYYHFNANMVHIECTFCNLKSWLHCTLCMRSEGQQTAQACPSNPTNTKSKKEGKDQESIQSITTPDPGYQWESDNFTIRHHKRELRGHPFPGR